LADIVPEKKDAFNKTSGLFARLERGTLFMKAKRKENTPTGKAEQKKEIMINRL